MALTRIRGGKAAVAPQKRSRKQKGATVEPYRERNLEGLTAGALYDRSLHASAMYVDKWNGQDIRRLIQPWQARSMSYYDLVPEVKFSASFFSQMLRGVRLFPAMLDTETNEPEELTDGPVVEAFDRIQDRAGGRSELQGSYAKLRFLIGETYLTVSPDVERGEVWECLSPNELRVQPGGLATRFRAPMLSGDQYVVGVDEYVVGNDPATLAKYGETLGPQFMETGPDVIVVYRLWRPHPAYTMLADCNMQAAMDILEELVLSTYSVRAQLKSRLNQGGILPFPDEVSFASLSNDPEEDPNSDEFQERLTNAIMTAIGDPGSSSAFAPIIVRMAGEWVDKIKLVRFNDSTGELAEIKQRDEMIGRFATCIELPKEVVTGTADINHWGAWLIDEQTWDSYGMPATLEMCSDLNAAYLQPAAREAGVTDWQRVCIGYDPSGVIHHQDSTDDTFKAFDRRMISKKTARERIGYNDNDEMPEDELNESIGVAIRDGSFAKYGIPSVKAGGIEPVAGDVESPAGAVDASGTVPPSGVDSEPGPPAGGMGDPPGGPATVASAVLDGREQEILGAARFAVHRGREMAGSKLRAAAQRSKTCPECLAAVGQVPNWNVAAILGEEQVGGLANGSRGGLVDGCGQAFAAVLEQMGVTPAWASELGELVEQHTARTLYQPVPDPLPPAFSTLLLRIGLPLERS